MTAESRDNFPFPEVAIDPIDRLLIERACERLILTYGDRADAGDLDAVVELFTDDAVVESPRGGPPLQGKSAIRAAYAGGGPIARRHLYMNIMVTVETPTEATAVSSIVLYTGRKEEGRALPTLDPHTQIGVTYDRIVSTATGWRFSRRRGTLSFE